MKTFNCIFIFVFLINIPLFPQFQKGYIINYDNDTTYGYIEFEGSIKNSERCTFKPDQNSETKVYYPGDIKAFRFIDGKYFMTWEIQVDNESQQVFLEWLLKGRASMLTYSPSDMKVRYFILPENDSLYELKNTLKIKKIKDEEDKEKIYQGYQKEYLGILRYFFRDSPSIIPQINATDFGSKSFIQIAKTYHEKTCDTIDCIIFEDDGRKIETHIGIAYNYFNSQIRFRQQTHAKLDMVNSQGGGISLKFSNLPVVSPKFSMHAQITYNKFLYTYKTGGLYWSDEGKILEYGVIRFPWQIQYNFSHTKLSPYIAAGLNGNYRFGYKYYKRAVLDYVTEVHVYDIKLSDFQLGLNTGLGLEYSISPDISVKAGLEYEYTLWFFRPYLYEYSYINNFIVQAVFLYRLK